MSITHWTVRIETLEHVGALTSTQPLFAKCGGIKTPRFHKGWQKNHCFKIIYNKQVNDQDPVMYQLRDIMVNIDMLYNW